MKIDVLSCCPFCGSTTFYEIDYPKGPVYYRFNADGSEADNTDMYNSLSFYKRRNDNFIYCDNCHKKIAYGETRELTKQTIRRINHNSRINLLNRKERKNEH